jgi:ABC-type Fe2+-enterobactin transport system substrate-binding protein
MKTFIVTIGSILSLALPVAASAAMTPIERYESQTQLSASWERPENRKLIEERVRLNQSYYQKGILTLSEGAFAANLVEIGKYS